MSEQIVEDFDLDGVAAKRLVITLEGFTLPQTADFGILRDGDMLLIRT